MLVFFKSLNITIMTEEEKTVLLNSFIKDYPSSTSADWQTFILAVGRTLDYLSSKEELTKVINSAQ